MFTSVLSTALVATTVAAERSSLDLETLPNPEMAPRRRADYFGRYPLERAAFELGERSVLTRLAREIEAVRGARSREFQSFRGSRTGEEEKKMQGTMPNVDGVAVCIYSQEEDVGFWRSLINGITGTQRLEEYYACKQTVADTSVAFCPDGANMRGLKADGSVVDGLQKLGVTCAFLDNEPELCSLYNGQQHTAMRIYNENDQGVTEDMPSDFQKMRNSLDYMLGGNNNHRCKEFLIPRDQDYDAIIMAGGQPVDHSGQWPALGGL